jgi:3' terminal RNA ribose 2'-O-methyltransferase Hen1
MPDASDLGYLLHKHPDRAQQFSVSSVGTAHVFWPEASAERAACSLLLEVDPVALVRGTGKQRNEAFSLSQYVNDRPYAAGSMLAVALGRVFHTAMSGICKSRQELADSAIPLDVDIPALSCCGDAELVDQLFAPLGWTVQATTTPLDPTVPEWGDSRYLRVRLTGTVRLADALTQLYVLIPALDGTKHYYVGEAEVDVLVPRGCRATRSGRRSAAATSGDASHWSRPRSGAWPSWMTCSQSSSTTPFPNRRPRGPRTGPPRSHSFAAARSWQR